MANTDTKKAENIEQIAIFGSAHADLDSDLAKEVFEVSKKLAQAGYIVVDGGGPGVMRVATMGAKSVGGRVIGITLQADVNMHYEGRDPENKFDIEIKAKNYVERTLALMREGQVYIIFKGGTGTISEFGMSWGLAKLYFGHHKPLILYGEFWKKIIAAFKENMMITKEEQEVYKIVSTPEGVLSAIMEFEDELKKGKHQHLQTTRGDFTI